MIAATVQFSDEGFIKLLTPEWSMGSFSLLIGRNRSAPVGQRQLDTDSQWGE